MKSPWFSAAVLIAAVFGSGWFSAGEGSDKKQEQKGSAEKPVLMCPVSGKPVSTTASIDYQGGKVYFCCEGCKPKFEADTAKYATKANYQLVASHQAKQVACPLSGKTVNPEISAKVAGVKVGFCCNICKSKLAKAAEDQQLELAFGSTAFEKAFKVKPKEKEKEESESSY